MRKSAIMTATFLALLAGCNSPQEESAVIDNSVNIIVHPVSYSDYKIPVRATGILGTSTQMKLSFKTGGLVRDILVSEGESVTAGQSLAILDLSEVKAHSDQAEIGYAKALRDLDRVKNLFRDSVATLEQLQNARSAFSLAASQKQIAEFNLKHSGISAPSEGKIQKILVEKNEMIAPGYPVILFASTENEWIVKVSLTDKDIVKLAIGDSAIVTMDAFPGEEIKAELTELGAIADPLTGTYNAEMILLKTFPQFRTGFIARAYILPSVTHHSLFVPIAALLDASDHTAFVYTYSDGTVERKRVSTGAIINDSVVIAEGIEEGDLVVTDGAAYLGKNTKVRLFNHQESAAK